jgi:hypothetical protein
MDIGAMLFSHNLLANFGSWLSSVSYLCGYYQSKIAVGWYAYHGLNLTIENDRSPLYYDLLRRGLASHKLLQRNTCDEVIYPEAFSNAINSIRRLLLNEEIISHQLNYFTTCSLPQCASAKQGALTICAKVGGQILCLACQAEQETITEGAYRERSILRPKLRYTVLSRDKFACVTCGRKPSVDPVTILHVDHVVPVALGGKTVLNNLQTLCDLCNLGKGASLPIMDAAPRQEAPNAH